VALTYELREYIKEAQALLETQRRADQRQRRIWEEMGDLQPDRFTSDHSSIDEI
jgi:hypothetical protein